MAAFEDGRVVIVDCGSTQCRVGLTDPDGPPGAVDPFATFPTAIWRKRMQAVVVGMEKIDWVGEEPDPYGAYSCRYPVENGIITNWNDMDRVWRHAFYEACRVAPEEHHVLLTESPLNPGNDREKLAQVMFEQYEVRGLCLANQAALSLYASGRTAGVVVDAGDGVTHVVPISGGHSPAAVSRSTEHAVSRLALAGRGLTAYLGAMLLSRDDVDLSQTMRGRELLRTIKEQNCYVALDFEREMQATPSEKTFELPDGKVVTAGQELFRCPEALFQPSLVDLEGPGIHVRVHNSIEDCGVDKHHELYRNIVLSSPTTLLPGFADRLHKELAALTPLSTVEICALPNRRYASFVGASTLASLSTFKEDLISRQEYNETGPSIVLRQPPITKSARTG